MASTAISESYMIVIAIVAASILSAAVLPSVSQITQVYNNKAQDFKIESETNIKVIFSFGVNGENTVNVWVKNTGKIRIPSSLIEQSDVFFGPVGEFSRIKYNETSGSTWNYTIENDLNEDSIWDPLETIKITITLDSPISTGDYYVKFATFQGSWSEYDFSI